MRKTKEELVKELTSILVKEDCGRYGDSDTAFNAPSRVATVLRYYCAMEQEHFIVVTLNTSLKIIRIHVVSKGLVDKTLVHPREVFRPAIQDNAKFIIVSHNHPSGSLVFSHDDTSVSKRLKECGELLGIPVIDSVIVTKEGWVSETEGSPSIW